MCCCIYIRESANKLSQNFMRCHVTHRWERLLMLEKVPFIVVCCLRSVMQSRSSDRSNGDMVRTRNILIFSLFYDCQWQSHITRYYVWRVGWSFCRHVCGMVTFEHFYILKLLSKRLFYYLVGRLFLFNFRLRHILFCRIKIWAWPAFSEIYFGSLVKFYKSYNNLIRYLVLSILIDL